MSTARSSVIRALVLIPALGVLTLTAGCVPHDLVWLPDSSGFVYTVGEHPNQLWVYDVAKREHRRVVKDTGGNTIVPGVSPDGKQIAVAELDLYEKDGYFRVIIFDLNGKELHRSEWAECPETSFRGENKATRATAIYWDTKGEKLIISMPLRDGWTAIYDVANKRTRIVDGHPYVFATTPVSPDGKGFLVLDGGADVKEGKEIRRPQLGFVDWDGKTKGIQLESKSNPNKTIPLIYSRCASHWEGNCAVLASNDLRFNIDCERLKATWEEKGPVDGSDDLFQQHSFPDGATIRPFVIKDKLGQLLNTGIELSGAGANKGRKVFENKDYAYWLSPSPNKKLVAVWCFGYVGTADKVLVINSAGEVLSEK
jgi:hypothetical protein